MKPACGYLSEAVAVPKKFDDIKAGYQRALRNGSSSPEDELDVRWLADYLTLAHDDDWYLAETAGGFWVRRSIDGTEAQVFRLVKKLLATFEPQVWLRRQYGCSIRPNPRRARATKGNGRRFRATWIIPDPATRLEF